MEPAATPALVLASLRQQLVALVLNSVVSPLSRRSYQRCLDDFLDWMARTGQPFTRAGVLAYRQALLTADPPASAASLNLRLSVVRKLAAEAAANGFLSQDVALPLVAVRGIPQRGVRTGNWLARSEAQEFLALPDAETTSGARDRALLGILLGCGLRRQEGALLRVEQIQQREGRWCIVDLVGKGGRIRTVPIPAWVKVLLDQWWEPAGIRGGFALRALDRHGRATDQPLGAWAIAARVRRYARRLERPLSAHDLRRTFAKLAYRGGAALSQIQFSLGHASIQTTERYLGVEQDLQDAPCDHLGLTIPG